MKKSEYITRISEMSDRYGNLLIQMMEEYGARNLQEISVEQAREFYEKITGGSANESEK